jgi:hypothetical protein
VYEFLHSPGLHEIKTLQFNDDWGDISIPADLMYLLKSSLPIYPMQSYYFSDSLDMVIQEDTASFSLHLKGDLSYSFALKNVFNVPNDSLPLFHISALPMSCICQIVRPAGNKPLMLIRLRRSGLMQWTILDSVTYCQWYTNHIRDSIKKNRVTNNSREYRPIFSGP